MQPKARDRLVGLGLLSVLVLLGALAVASTIRGQRAVGVMPEVVSIADRPRLVVDKVLAPASRPAADAVSRLSGINK